MTIFFFIPLSMIALFESSFNRHRNKWIKHWLGGIDEGEADAPENRDPQMDPVEEVDGLIISRVKFDELIKTFPNTEQV
jgi:hypothetical protein